MSKPERSKSTSQTRGPKSDFDTKSEDDVNNKTVNRKPFLSKGSGMGGGKGNKAEDNENEDELIQSTPKFTQDGDLDHEASSPDGKGSESSKNRRSRKARGPNAQSTFDTQDNFVMEKKNSLEEFEEFEKGITTQDDEYQVVTKSERPSEKKKKKAKPDTSSNETSSKPDLSKTMNKNVNESGTDRQRLAKEKQEFRKQKEKFEADKLALEKQKRDFDKQKLDFDKLKDMEMKKINAEKMKVEKERKALTRQDNRK